MAVEELEHIIEILPRLILYFVPYIVFLIFYGLLSPAKKEVKIFSFDNVIYSFILNTIVSQLGFWLFKVTSVPIPWIIISCALLGFICGVVSINPWIDKNIVGKLFHRTMYDEILYGIMDRKHGCYIDIFMDNNIIYHGILFEHYCNKDGKWVVLSDYSLTQDNCLILDYTKDTNFGTHQVAISMEHVSRFHVVYANKSSRRNL